jgi:hypothetical protein
LVVFIPLLTLSHVTHDVILWFTAAAASANDEDDDAEQLRASIAGVFLIMVYEHKASLYLTLFLFVLLISKILWKVHSCYILSKVT